MRKVDRQRLGVSTVGCHEVQLSYVKIVFSFLLVLAKPFSLVVCFDAFVLHFMSWFGVGEML